MCELKVLLENEVKFDNVIYAKSVNNNVVVSDVLGNSMEFKNCQIIEVNIGKEMLILEPVTNQ